MPKKLYLLHKTAMTLALFACVGRRMHTWKVVFSRGRKKVSCDLIYPGKQLPEH